MAQPKNVKVFLAQGTASGIATAEIGQWSGRAVVFPRAQVAEIAAHGTAQGTGIYVLSGPDETHDEREAIYVGEADNVAKRVLQHNSEDFWSRACLFTASDGNLTKAHARYLEARLLMIARGARRARVLNGTSPMPPALPPAEREDMEHFIANAIILLPLLGFHFAEPLASKASAVAESAEHPTFHLKAVGVEARAREVGGEFVVLAGSTARVHGTSAWATGRKLREQLVEERILVSGAGGQLYRFQEDVPFQSLSTAASVVVASNQNGRVAWKLATGETYAEWHEAQVAELMS